MPGSEMKVQAEGGHRGGGLGSDAWSVASAGGPPPGVAPPGFQASQSAAYDDARAQGEALRSVGALSAPPPPGFNSDKSSRLPSNPEALWSSHGGGGHRSEDKGIGGGSGGGRTNSYTDLAAALGSGLAESMDDATRGEHKGGALLTDNFFLNPKNDLSYARQSRHAASRLLGTSPSKDAFGPSHKAPEAGSLFVSYDSGERGLPIKKSNSGQQQQPMFGDYPREAPKPKRDPSSGLTAAFSNDSDSADRMGGFRPAYPPKSSASSYDVNGGDMMKSRLPTTKDLGMTVTEPSDSYGHGQGHGHPRGPPSSNMGGLGTPEKDPVDLPLPESWVRKRKCKRKKICVLSPGM
jgi:hypothetical protein